MSTRVVRVPGVSYGVDALASVVAVFEESAATGPVRVTGVISRGGNTSCLEGTDEFLAEYALGADQAVLTARHRDGQLDITVDRHETVVAAQLPDEAQVDVLMRVLLTTPPTSSTRPRIFVGHGPHDHWRLLAELLRSQHGLEILTFESAARAGLSVIDVLHDLTKKAEFALLIHTRDWLDENGVGHASQNVVYETGYFQAMLGQRRAVVVREEGCAEYANVTGANQIRFHSGAIAAVVGDVLAVLRREFPGL